MASTIQDYQLPHVTHKLYDVLFQTNRVRTLVTSTPALVDRWISEMPQDITIVGLDVEAVEWCPNSDNPIMTLQLCVGHTYLIFQIIHAPYIPLSFVNFLRSSWHTFVCVRVEADVEKLASDHGLSGSLVDSGVWAAVRLRRRELRNAGLRQLALDVVGKEINKPQWVTMSRWDDRKLTLDQVQYACLDAFLSYLIGKELDDFGMARRIPL